MSKEVILSAENLSKTYNDGLTKIVAVNNIDLKIYEGEMLVITGNSGCGKSTLLNLLGGIDRIDSGKIFVNGQNICDFNDKKMTIYRRENVGFVFQMYSLIMDLTVRENINLAKVLAKSSCDIDELLSMVGLLERANDYPAKLSGGEQQRVAIARAIAKDTKLLLCDEPTGALDYETGKQIMKLLESLVKDKGYSVVIVTHTNVIAKAANRSIKLKNGKIVEEIVNKEPISICDLNW